MVVALLPAYFHVTVDRNLTRMTPGGGGGAGGGGGGGGLSGRQACRAPVQQQQ